MTKPMSRETVLALLDGLETYFEDHDPSCLVGVRELRAQIEALVAERDAWEGCPCTLTIPCHPECTCIAPSSSRGCRRCCKYGSVEQRVAQAERLAALVAERLPGDVIAKVSCPRPVRESEPKP